MYYQDLGAGEIQAPIRRDQLNPNSGFMSQIDSYIRNKGVFLAHVGGKPTDAETNIWFQPPMESRKVLGIAAGLFAGGLAVGFLLWRKR